MVAGGIAMLGVIGATSLTVWLMKPAVDDVLAAGDPVMMWVVGLGLPAAFALKGLANYAQRACMLYAGLGLVATARSRLFGHLLSLDLAFFQRHQSGDLTSRLINDLDTLKTTITATAISLGRDAGTLVALIGTLLLMDWELALVGLAIFPVLVLPVMALGRRARRQTTTLQETLGRYDAMLHQAFEGVRVVKVFATPARERARLHGVVMGLFEAMYQVSRAMALTSLFIESAAGIAVTLVVLYGGHRVVSGESTPGTFFAFITALILAYRPIKKLGGLNALVQEGIAAIDRLFEVLDSRPTLREAPDARPLRVTAGAVRLEGVRVSHADTAMPALQSVSLTCAPGRKVALVGPSGAGKSTTLNLIARLLDPTDGRVLIDGQDIRDVTLDSLWRHVGLVTQDVTLFDGTVLENILFGCPDRIDPRNPPPCWRTRAETAARDAEAHDFIMDLPHGYDTDIGESGLRLSGGQRQRIAIARAMLKNPPILLLDEATAAMDRDTERRVQVALDRLGRGRTTLVVAHRLATIRDADLICVMDRGRVVESGHHSELLETGGLYANLWATQGGDPPVPEASRPAADADSPHL
ncbi:ABC transporter ATP-binding protein [Rhodospira trueperi]|uniref:ATP-binding cassette, subfamily B, MsbA n=1 Tax=Rhodospira trueperi TaxID=69960 RepID=A0A1G7DUE1_9PROT|nr:ABC transporter ATP-binding protein [Rhodospira trueperi]SDE55124.1 ATP-binding cassette, subfamily B, MsbA [Rhodospira trueperi]